MNRFVLIVISAFVLVLSACGGGSSNPNPNPNPNPQPSNQIVGKYNGELTIENTLDSSKFVSALTTLTVAGDGTLAGTATTKSPSDVIEQGTITGKAVYSNDAKIEFNLTAQFPTLGTYTASGNGIYASVTKELAINVSAKDSNGTFVGRLILIVQKE
jgi:hypothetical protein